VWKGQAFGETGAQEEGSSPLLSKREKKRKNPLVTVGPARRLHQLTERDLGDLEELKRKKRKLRVIAENGGKHTCGVAVSGGMSLAALASGEKRRRVIRSTNRQPGYDGPSDVKRRSRRKKERGQRW